MEAEKTITSNGKKPPANYNEMPIWQKKRERDILNLF
jgi:hypothetical protein